VSPPASVAEQATAPKATGRAPKAQSERVPTKITTKNPYRE
jgi:hypothetical protein